MAGYDSVIGDVDFWVYCQPVGFYNVLAMRSRSLEHAHFMRRSLAYARKSPKLHAEAKNYVRVKLSDLSLAGFRGEQATTQAVSLIVAVCETIPQKQEFRPVVARLAHLCAAGIANGAAGAGGHAPSSSGSGAAGGTAAAQPATGVSGASGSSSSSSTDWLVLPVPDHDLFEPRLLVMAWEAHLDMRVLYGKKPLPGRWLSSDLSKGKMCGLIPSGSAILFGSLSINGSEHTGPVVLRPGIANVARKQLLDNKTPKALYTIAVQTPSSQAQPADLLAKPSAAAAASSSAAAASASGGPSIGVTASMAIEGEVSLLMQTPQGIVKVRHASQPKPAPAAAAAEAAAAVAAPAAHGSGNAAAAAPSRQAPPPMSPAAALQAQRPPGLPSPSHRPSPSQLKFAEPPPANHFRPPPQPPAAAAGVNDAGPSGGPGARAAPPAGPAGRANGGGADGGGGAGAGSSSAAASDAAIATTVCYKYVYSRHHKYVAEAMPELACAFCGLKCAALTGLQQHLVASHDLFEFRFATQPDGRPVVMVSVPLSVYDVHGILTRPLEDRNPGTGAPLGAPWWYCQRQHASRLHLILMGPSAAAAAAAASAASGGGAAGQAAGGAEAERSSQYGAGAVPIEVLFPTYEEEGPSLNLGGYGAGGPGGGGMMMGGRGAGRRTFTAKRQATPQAPSSSGHAGRLYFHAKTVMPLAVAELEQADGDSDDETDEQDWQRSVQRDLLQHKHITPCERRFMLMWNTFHHHHPIYADFQAAPRCVKFAQQHAAQLVSDPELRSCFVLHLIMLWDYALVDSATLDSCLAILDKQALQQQQQQPKQPAQPPPPRPPISKRSASVAEMRSLRGLGA